MELLKQLYNISSPSRRENAMITFISNKLTEMGVAHTIDKAGNIYATKGKGKTFPCLVAHTDEVHYLHTKGYEVVTMKDEIIVGYDSEKREFQGIGADDKNGIWICLKCLEEYDNLKCAFFVEEEIGCQGSRVADMEFFKDCRFVLQCDRKGNSDIITKINGLKLCSKEFIEALNPGKYGYKTTEGLSTDVGALKDRKLEISCINISCGYYNPHTKNEFTHIGDLMKCLDLVKHVITDCQQVYPHINQPKPVRKPTRGFYRESVDYDMFGMDAILSSLGVQQEKHKAPKRIPYMKQYYDLTTEMTKLLSNDPDLRVADIMKLIGDKHEGMTKPDFRCAYYEITGHSDCLPSQSETLHRQFM